MRASKSPYQGKEDKPSSDATQRYKTSLPNGETLTCRYPPEFVRASQLVATDVWLVEDATDAEVRRAVRRVEREGGDS